MKYTPKVMAALDAYVAAGNAVGRAWQAAQADPKSRRAISGAERQRGQTELSKAYWAAVEAHRTAQGRLDVALGIEEE